MHEIITLSNGKRVANFSSPHIFEFEDGSILPAVPNDEAKRLKVDFIEIPVVGGLEGDVELRFNVSLAVVAAMGYWTDRWLAGDVDVVICCLPMIVALQKAGYNIIGSPFRAVRMDDSRIKKVVSIHKQCV